MPSPVEIEVALHYYYSTDDYTATKRESPAVGDAIRKLVSNGLLIDRKVHVGSDEAPRWYKTRGLDVYVERLIGTPLPSQKQVWVFPDDN